MLKRLYIFVLLTFSFPFSSHSQNTIVIRKPLVEKVLAIFSYESDSLILYSGMSNQLRINVPDEKTRRTIIVPIDTQKCNVEANWKPYSQDSIIGNKLGVLTLAYAQRKGAYRPYESDDSRKFLDTNGVIWEKEYSFIPKVNGYLDFEVYQNIGKDLVYYCGLKFISYDPPVPKLIIPNFEHLKNNWLLIPSYDKTFKKGEENFKIRAFTFTALDKNHKIIFTSRCFGNSITPEMIKVLDNPKLRHIKISNIESYGYKYGDIEL